MYEFGRDQMGPDTNSKLVIISGVVVSAGKYGKGSEPFEMDACCRSSRDGMVFRVRLKR